MKQSIALFIFLLGSLHSFAQNKYFFGAGVGVSFINGHALSSLADAAVDNRLDIISPALIGIYINDKSRIRLDLTRYKIHSKLNYIYNVTQPNDPSVPNQTKVVIKAESINLNYDYRVVNKGKLEVFASAGLRSQFSTKMNESTTFKDGREAETNLLIHDYDRNVFGVGAGVVTKFNYTEQIGFTFIPDYAFYFGGFNKGDSNKLKRLSLALGVEVKL